MRLADIGQLALGSVAVGQVLQTQWCTS